MDAYKRSLAFTKCWLNSAAQHNSQYLKVIEAFEVSQRHHNGVRNGGAPEFSHQLEIFRYVFNLHGCIQNPALVYKLIFMHDALEDPNQDTGIYLMEEYASSIFTEDEFIKLKNISKSIEGYKNPGYSLDTIFNDRELSIVKGADRVNNVKSMIGVFNPARLKRYAQETTKEFLFRLDECVVKFPEQAAIYKAIKNDLIFTLSTNNLLST
jgi:(p)ppGpp synthase/HD superfamily hydrolase